MVRKENYMKEVTYAAAILIIAVLVVWKAGEFISLEQKKTLSAAVDGCGKIATVSWTDKNNGSIIIEPYKKGFDECMKNKGY